MSHVTCQWSKIGGREIAYSTSLKENSVFYMQGFLVLPLISIGYNTALMKVPKSM